ncbi:GNAT family N-acetyltransferase [Croceicoccus sp. YJ47]|uniref:GNAT family N-acetyltransferase n=1 Tax=Croceicoccus sp. YJ47 TaxID=2798724 RepID=UPI0019215A51|nr:GNAT family N-acetyltransferase [Croceicoccus sp. YJ47]QQN74978.1 N-acetyltransferase [Croceicoccus sp. YJ47]
MSESATIRLNGSVGALDAAAWDALNHDGNPFTSHRFLALLEQSGSVGGHSGWTPLPMTLHAGESADAPMLGVVPAYLKAHSQGEYVFDHGWADAWERAGGSYYPKLQIAVPFTPATGPRVLAADEDVALTLLAAVERFCESEGLSSAHATFVAPEQQALFERAGWLLRHDIQFHWTNRGYTDFEAFLDSLASRKRKAIRKERARAVEGLEIRDLVGDDIRPEHWDAFWQFYQDTGARKWGTPYLTREAFDLIGARMGEDVLLMLAFEDGTPVAGALNFIGPDALYGRYWGALVDKPFLHFELCYYRAIDAAIARGLSRVEAGAQGSHKLARGYEPVRTTSAHFIPHPDFRRAVADFLREESEGIDASKSALQGMAPFKRS